MTRSSLSLMLAAAAALAAALPGGAALAGSGERKAERGARAAADGSEAPARQRSERIARSVGAAATALAGVALAADPDEPDPAAGSKGERKRQCYRFSKQAVGTTWQRGDRVPTAFGAVEVDHFYIDGTQFVPQKDGVQFLKVNQTRIAQGESPELHGSLVNVRLLPSRPVRGISMKFAQQVGGGGQLPANLEVNGERRDYRGSLAQADGQTLGAASLRVQLEPDASTAEQPSHWQRGTLEIRAAGGTIETLAFGAQLFNFDDLCIHR